MASKGELIRRLHALQVPTEVSLPDLSHYSLAELEGMKVSFGEKWKGSTFKHVWEQDQTYINWFLHKYHGSPKLDHRLLLTFIEAMVDQAELREQEIPITLPSTETQHSKSLCEGGMSSEIASTPPKPPMRTATKTRARPSHVPATVRRRWMCGRQPNGRPSRPTR